MKPRRTLFWILFTVVALLAKPTVYAQDSDSVEGEEGDGVQVDGDEVPNVAVVDETPEEQTAKLLAELDTFVLWTKPEGRGLGELPSGRDASFLVGVLNKGNADYTVDLLDASFRYAQDFTYVLQNFTPVAYEKVIHPQQEVTLAYQFFISDQYTPRSYGFQINLHFRDEAGVQYTKAVFNETVNIVEISEGFDTELFFLYLLFAAFIALGAFGVYQLFSGSIRKHAPSRTPVETGTSNANGVDYDWLPEGTHGKYLNGNGTAKEAIRKRSTKGTTARTG